MSFNSILFFFFFSSRRRHTRSKRDWSSDVCSSDLRTGLAPGAVSAVNKRFQFFNQETRVIACQPFAARSEEHTSELQSRFDLVCRLLLEKKNLYTVTLMYRSMSYYYPHILA